MESVRQLQEFIKGTKNLFNPQIDETTLNDFNTYKDLIEIMYQTILESQKKIAIAYIIHTCFSKSIKDRIKNVEIKELREIVPKILEQLRAQNSISQIMVKLKLKRKL
jgi:predicted metal-dependent hydrolase